MILSEIDTATHFIPVEQVRVSAYEIPTDSLEADGSLQWHSTTLVLVEVDAGNKTGIGYTYAGESTAFLIEKKLKEIVLHQNALIFSSAPATTFQYHHKVVLYFAIQQSRFASVRQ